MEFPKATNRQKYIARSLLSAALVSGKLVARPCETCGETKVDGHHADYGKPLEVIWLCRRHHIEEHRRIKDAQPKKVKVKRQAIFIRIRCTIKRKARWKRGARKEGLSLTGMIETAVEKWLAELPESESDFPAESPEAALEHSSKSA